MKIVRAAQGSCYHEKLGGISNQVGDRCPHDPEVIQQWRQGDQRDYQGYDPGAADQERVIHGEGPFILMREQEVAESFSAGPWRYFF